MKIGFVPLLDAAPIIAALELGYFSDEGLNVVLHCQIGWGNVRDKLTFGHLHASHALLGMPAASVLGQRRYPEALVGLLSLGFGGNAVSVSRALSDTGVDSAASLANWIKRAPRGHAPPLLAHVFGASTHHYLLRDWLASGNVDPDRDVRLCVLPPPQMVGHLKKGYLDGFCVGEPWNTTAVEHGCGKILISTTDLLPEHPEKLLAVTRRWLAENSQAAEGMVRAMLRAGEFCGNPANQSTLAEMLEQPGYFDIDPGLISRSLAMVTNANLAASAPSPSKSRHRSAPASFYGISPSTMFPSASHTAWLLMEMKRWKHLDQAVDIRHVAALSTDTSVYRKVATSMNVACPQEDFAPMRLRHGWLSIPATEPQTTLVTIH